MRKMRLDINRLAVESFELAAGATDSRGTIQGNATPPTPACSGVCSYQQSCVNTCGISCNGSCLTNYICC